MATLKQRKSIEKLVETHGSVSAAMRLGGYTDKSAKNPKNLTNSKAWETLMTKYLPDNLLMQRHQELLNKREIGKVFNHDTGEYEFKIIDQPDSQAVSRGLDMAYKLKRKYPSEDQTNVIIGIKIDV
jgi:hypothetical protein